MLFHSTRGKDQEKTFKEVLMQGLASDGGLFMPNYWPAVDLEHLKNCNTFIDVAKHIVPLFTDSSFDTNDVEDMLDNTWHDFAEKNLLKIVEINKTASVLELFHGPTAAFKDFGLQLAAAFFNKTLETENKTAIVFGATSGDTGSAAIDACKQFKSIKSFILIPEGNMSEIQRKQMTTVDKSNVFPILADGTFDDCQDIVKEGFKQRSFLKNDQYLLAVNSINWVRIIAKMGLPLSKIIVAVNSNDILYRFFKENDYSKRDVTETISPSMDISVASNFERLLYDFYLDRNSKVCSDIYSNFPKTAININEDVWQKSDELFLSYSVDDNATYATMKYFKNEFNYIIDPHTAVAAEAVLKLNHTLSDKTLILSTAHPAKFPDALKKSNILMEDMPKRLIDVINKKEIAKNISTSDNSIYEYIRSNN